MSLKRLESQGLIEKISYNDKQIVSNIKRAGKDLITAKANIEIDEEWAYTIAYHAMLRAGRALMFSKGTGPKAEISIRPWWIFAKIYSARISGI